MVARSEVVLEVFADLMVKMDKIAEGNRIVLPDGQENLCVWV
jgi:hypothetical protein